MTENRFAMVKVFGNDELVRVSVSGSKPEIPEVVREKWQEILNLLSRVMKVPTGLITHFTQDNLEIFAASESQGNPYKKDDSDHLGIGMFCETVAATGRKLFVNNTEEDEYWEKNPHSGFGMRSYCGVPIYWNDQELFGTFCVLSDKPGSMSEDYINLLEHFRFLIERDLAQVVQESEMEKQLYAGRMRLKELHHRIKNQFAIIISYINIKSRESADNDLVMILREVQHRIMALSLIHESLYMTENTTVPPMDKYLPTLCDYIISDLADLHIDVRYSIDPVILDMDVEIQIALIVSELLTNSLKHAFSDFSSPYIELCFKKGEDGGFRLTYRDNGPGYPDYVDLETTKSIGLMLIRVLSEDVKAEASIRNENGVVFSLYLPG